VSRDYFLLSSATLALVIAAPAYAQSAQSNQPSTAQPTASSDDVIPDIIVTAQRRSESLQKTPLAVSAIPAADLTAGGVSSLAQIQGLFPATQFQANANNSISVDIRGITNNNIQIIGEAPISYNYNGVPVTHAIAQPGGLYDIERIEVLRGPQGTLYGRNSTGGAVNIITKKPVLGRLEASGQLGYGNYDALNVSGMVNVPAGDSFAVRAVAEHIRHDGYTADGFNDQNTLATRIGALYKNGPVSLFVGADYTVQDAKGTNFSDCPPGSANAGPALAVPGGPVLIPNYCANIAWQPYAGERVDEHNRDNFVDVTSTGVYAELNVDLPFGTATYIPGYRTVKQTSRDVGTTPVRVAMTGGDYGHVAIDIFDDHAETQSHELRLSSKPSSPFKWVLGGFYLEEKVHDFRNSITNLPIVGPAAVPGIRPFALVRQDLTTKSLAGFAQVTYPIIDAIRLTGGIRYTHDTQENVGNTVSIQADGSQIPIDATATLRYSKVTFKAGFDADLAPTSLLYGSVSTGYKSGGINPGVQPNTFPPELVTAYEGGIKNTFLHGRLRVNVSAFHYDYQNYQFQYFGTIAVPNPQVPGTTILLQQSVTQPAAKVKISGAELETFLVLPGGLSFDASASYLDAKFKEFVLGTTNYGGNQVPFAPKWTLTGGVQKKFDLGSAGSLTAGIHTQYYTKQRAYYYDAPGSIQEAYTNTDLSLTWASASNKVRVTGWVRNVENYAHITYYITQSPFNATNAQVSPPRTFGATFNVQY